MLNSSNLIEYNYVTGFMVDLLENINDSINRLKATNAKVKVGVSGIDPQDFFEDALNKYEWDRMVILYETRSKKFVDDLRNHIVNINWFSVDEKSGTGDYILYALIKE